MQILKAVREEFNDDVKNSIRNEIGYLQVKIAEVEAYTEIQQKEKPKEPVHILLQTDLEHFQRRKIILNMLKQEIRMLQRV